MEKLCDNAAAEADFAIIKNCGLSGGGALDLLREVHILAIKSGRNQRCAVAEADGDMKIFWRMRCMAPQKDIL